MRIRNQQMTPDYTQVKRESYIRNFITYTHVSTHVYTSYSKSEPLEVHISTVVLVGDQTETVQNRLVSNM